MSNFERRALNSLQDDDSIIIRKSDKGSCCVIQDRADYIFELDEQLNNQNHYRELDTPIFMETAKKINDILKTLVTKMIISDAQYDYLSAKPNVRQRHIYSLPKIHKNPETEWTVARKIPKAIKHPSYLKDTTDFIEKIKKSLENFWQYFEI